MFKRPLIALDRLHWLLVLPLRLIPWWRLVIVQLFDFLFLSITCGGGSGSGGLNSVLLFLLSLLSFVYLPLSPQLNQLFLDRLEHFNKHAPEVYSYHRSNHADIDPPKGGSHMDIINKVSEQKHKVRGHKKCWLVEYLHSIQIGLLEWFDGNDEWDHQQWTQHNYHELCAGIRQENHYHWEKESSSGKQSCKIKWMLCLHIYI